MNLNIYLENELAEQIVQYAKETGQARNAIIREALKEWVVHHISKPWPQSVLNFKGCPEMPSFESTRSELTSSTEDPFA